MSVVLVNDCRDSCAAAHAASRVFVSRRVATLNRFRPSIAEAVVTAPDSAPITPHVPTSCPVRKRFRCAEQRKRRYDRASGRREIVPTAAEFFVVCERSGQDSERETPHGRGHRPCRPQSTRRI